MARHADQPRCRHAHRGIYAVGAGGSLELGGTITTDAATIVLFRTGEVVAQGGTTLEQSLTDITAGGRLDVLGQRDFTTGVSFTDAGTLHYRRQPSQ